jgi:hypothetical protein
LRRDILQVMPLVQHQPAVRRQDRRVLPVLLRPAHRQVGGQQVVVHHHDVRLCRAPARAEQEAAIEVRALHAAAQVGLRAHLFPHLRRRLVGEIRQRAIRAVRRPVGEGVKLLQALRLEQGALPPDGQVDAGVAQVVVPPLEQRERRRPFGVSERPGQQGQVLAHQLFLQVDGVGGDDGPLAVGQAPVDGRHQIGEGLPHSGARLQERHTALVVGVGHICRHVALAGPVLERAEHLGHRTTLPQRVGLGHGVQRRVLRRLGYRHHDVQVLRCVVDDAEPDPGVVQLGRHVQIGGGRLEVTPGVVVQRHLTPRGDPRQGQHAVGGATGSDPDFGDAAVRVEGGDERDLPPPGFGDLRGQQRAGRGGNLAHVLSSRFRAAGNRTLLRMSRYPGELGWSERSVGGSPI